MFGRRPDATLVTDLPAVRRFMPMLSARRNDNLVYYGHELSAEPALRFVEQWNQGRDPARRLTLFHLLLRSLARVAEERPRLNRFVAGGRLWQRDGVWISLSAKRSFEDGSPILTVKRRFDPDESLDALVDGLTGGLRRGRSGERTTSDKEVDLLLRLPPFVVRGLLRLARGVDAFGLLPGSMIEPDPMYCAFFVANLGSVGLEAGYHHLWEHGNCPFFCVMGAVREGADGARVVPLKWTFDERVEDGFYCARSLERLAEIFAHPEKL